MSEEVKTMNIFQRMSAITTECEAVAKNLTVGKGTNKEYKAVGEGDVLRAIKPIEAKYGVYSYPFKREVIQSEYYTNKDGKSNQFMRIETIYRFVNADRPEEYIDIITYGDGVDSQDKAPGKAMTYGDKYALLKAYKIETGDDPDGNQSGDMGNKQSPAAPPASKRDKKPVSKEEEKPVSKEEEKPVSKEEEKPFVFTPVDIFKLCDKLGKSVESVQKYSAEKYGRNVEALGAVELDELGSMLWAKAHK